MISAIAQYIEANVKALNLFEAVFSMADVITDGTKSYPAIYCSNGSYDRVNNDFSSYSGLCYFRMSGEVGNVEVDSDVSCDTVRQITYPIKMVCAIPKTKLGDDRFSDDRLASSVAAALSGKTTVLRKTLNARLVEIVIGNSEHDNQKIIASEYTGIELVDVDYKLSYLSVEFSVAITINNDCIDACDTDNIINGFDWCKAGTYAQLSDENKQCIENTFCSSGAAGSVNVNQSDGDLIANVSGEDPAAEYNVADSAIQSSAGNFIDSVQATSTYVIADNAYTDSAGNPQTEEYGTLIDCTVGLGRVYRPPLPSGQYSIFRTGDEGTQIQAGTYNYNPFAGTLVDLDKSNAAWFTTLTTNNTFGNPDRFTNDVGGQETDGTGGSTPDYIIDHYTGLGWYIALNTPTNWNAQIDAAALITTAAPAFHSDFRMPNKPEGESIADSSISLTVFDYPPFNLNLVNGMWTSTTFATSTGRAYQLSQNGDTGLQLKSSVNGNLVAVRNHFV